MTMQEQLKNLTDSLTGFKLVRTVPSDREGVMDLTFEIEDPRTNALATVKKAVGDAKLTYAAIALFPAVPKSAVLLRGVSVAGAVKAGRKAAAAKAEEKK